MGSEASFSDVELEKFCDCGCVYCSSGFGNCQRWNRAVKRKVDGFEDENGFVVPGLCYPVPSIARVNIENECDALRGIVNRQQESIQHLHVELEEERNSSTTAANEAMSMILRLQRDKSEIQMEARQFKRYAEERMAHDQQEISALEDILYKREQVIQSLTCEAQAYRHRMMSYGLPESEVDEEFDDDSNNSMFQEGQFPFSRFDYPPIKCISNEVNSVSEVENEFNDFEKYSIGGTPQSVKHLKNLELRISQMETSPRINEVDMESPAAKSEIKNVIVGQSRMGHSRKFSVESSNSLLGYGKQSLSNFPGESPRFGNSFKKMDYVVHTSDPDSRDLSEARDFMNDTLYTYDPVYNRGLAASPSESMNCDEVNDPEIRKLQMRLQALEEEKESLRQTLIHMGTDKAQSMLLKEIAQQLCKDMTTKRRMPPKKLSLLHIFPFLTVFKWIASVVFWRKGLHQSRYMFELTSNMGLLMLLDRKPRAKPWRCLTRPLV